MDRRFHDWRTIVSNSTCLFACDRLYEHLLVAKKDILSEPLGTKVVYANLDCSSVEGYLARCFSLPPSRLSADGCSIGLEGVPKDAFEGIEVALAAGSADGV